MNTLYSKITEKKKLLNYICVFVIVLLIPVNFGYHFISPSVYVGGILLDYLIPTIYLQDIMTGLFLIINLDYFSKNAFRMDKYVIWFLFTILLASIGSFFLFSSLFFFMRTFLYISFAYLVSLVYSKEEISEMVVTALSFSITFLGVLGVLQWFGQGSVFDNYLILGEQPYSSSTPGIIVENFFGVAKTPPYGTFRHPNIFAGFLSIGLVWLLSFIKKRRLLLIPFVLGLITLFFTLSYVAWGAFILGVVYLYFHQKENHAMQKGLLMLTVVITLSALFLPSISPSLSLTDKPSVYRRIDLMASSYGLAEAQPLFGFGPSTSSAYIDRFLPTKHDIRLSQPPHNIIVLLLVESGIFAVAFFLIFFFKKLFKAYENNSVLVIFLLQILFLGSFDHYLITMHQTNLLMWLILLIV